MDKQSSSPTLQHLKPTALISYPARHPRNAAPACKLWNMGCIPDRTTPDALLQESRRRLAVNYASKQWLNRTCAQ